MVRAFSFSPFRNHNQWRYFCEGQNTYRPIFESRKNLHEIWSGVARIHRYKPFYGYQLRFSDNHPKRTVNRINLLRTFPKVSIRPTQSFRAKLLPGGRFPNTVRSAPLDSIYRDPDIVHHPKKRGFRFCYSRPRCHLPPLPIG